MKAFSTIEKRKAHKPWHASAVILRSSEQQLKSISSFSLPQKKRKKHSLYPEEKHFKKKWCMLWKQLAMHAVWPMKNSLLLLKIKLQKHSIWGSGSGCAWKNQGQVACKTFFILSLHLAVSWKTFCAWPETDPFVQSLILILKQDVLLISSTDKNWKSHCRSNCEFSWFFFKQHIAFSFSWAKCSFCFSSAEKTKNNCFENHICHGLLSRACHGLSWFWSQKCLITCFDVLRARNSVIIHHEKIDQKCNSIFTNNHVMLFHWDHDLTCCQWTEKHDQTSMSFHFLIILLLTLCSAFLRICLLAILFFALTTVIEQVKIKLILC